ncbi:MAG: putative metal-binding motif-containing protein, partial [Phycisphaerales bacterium]
MHTPIDADGDGYPPIACGGGDCDDSNPDVNPGAKELCGDGIDNDCDGLVDCDDPDCAGDSGCGGGSGAFADLCSDAPLVQGGFLPVDTLGATGSGTVGGVAIQKDVWAKYVPDCSGLVTVSNCPAYGESVPPDWDSVIALWVGTSCGSLQLLAVSDNFCGVQGAVVAPVTAGATYFIQIGGKGAVNAGIGTVYVACGDCGGCAEGALLEQEPCGVRLNDACNVPGTPATQPIEPGQSFCGEIWASGNARDTDFYSFTLNAPAVVEWTVRADLPLYTQIFAAGCPFGDAIAIGDFLVCPGSLTVSLPPGTYWAFVGTYSFEGLPCNAPIERRYTATLAVTELVELCDNGTDDDGDGLIDCDDPDCAAFPDCS